MGRFTEEDIRQVIAAYEATKTAALTERDGRLREIHAAGWRAVELQRVTGYSRETIRQALNPQARTDTNAGRRLATADRAEETGARDAQGGGGQRPTRLARPGPSDRAVARAEYRAEDTE